MQKNIEERNAKKKGALISAIGFATLIILYMGGILLLFKGIDEVSTNLFVLFYVIIGLAGIIGVGIALKQRFKEIDSGEAEEAKKY
jgi:uncharacterized membrane protein YuzA (DUF378 family)